MSHPGNTIGDIEEDGHARSNVHPKTAADKTEGVSDNATTIYFVDGYDANTKTIYEFNGCFIWFGRHKELWIKGAAGTGSVDQQAVERHW